MTINRAVARAVGFTLLAGLVGHTLNVMSTGAMASLMLGRVATLPVAIFFGPAYGVAAAVLGAFAIGSVSITLVTVFALEAVILGVFARLGKSPILGSVLVAALFSLSLGLFPHAYGLPPLGTALVPLALQRLLGFMLAPVIADFISAVASSRGLSPGPAGQRRRLRPHFFHGFMLVGTLPVLLVSTISGHLFADSQRAQAGGRLSDMATSLAERVDSYMEMHLAGTAALAVTVADLPFVGNQSLLDRFGPVFPGFRAVALADATGLVREIAPLSRARVGLSIKDREFFQEAIASRRGTISDVTLSPSNSDPVVFLGAPVVGADGAVAGVAHASLSLEAFQYFVESYITLPSSAVTILDRHNRVIVASDGAGYITGQDLTTSLMVAAADASAVGDAFEYMEGTEGGAATEQMSARSIVSLTGWTVFVQQPRAMMALQTPTYYLLTIALIMVALAGSAIGARVFANTVASPLEDLVAIVRGASVHGSNSALTLSPTAPAEIAALVDDVKGMEGRLAESYAQLEHSLAQGKVLNLELEALTGQLEKRVDERTAELASTNAILENIITALPGALLVADQSGHIRLSNENAVSLLGRSASDLERLSLDDVFAAAAGVSRDDEDAFARGGVLRTERTLLTGAGERVPVLVSAARIEGAPGTGSQTICIAIDIRDRKKLESELHQAQKLESVGRLAAGVAHEINTPAQFVSDSIQFVRDGMTDLAAVIDKYRLLVAAVAEGRPSIAAAEAVTRAEQEADLDYLLVNIPSAIDRSLDGLGRVTTIVRSMKEFAHPDQKEMSAVDLNRAVESTLVIARNEYKYVADVETHFGDVPQVVCHAGDVNQAVLNILVNAAHAIGDTVAGTENRGRIVIATSSDGEFAEIRISDSGGGIPEHVRAHIFEPFFTTKEVGKGTGQGLAIARSVILEKHQGEFTFETVTGTGTTFVIRLPINGPKRRTGEVAA